MPLGEAHRRQRQKNFFLLGVLLALVAALYYLAILKLTH